MGACVLEVRLGGAGLLRGVKDWEGTRSVSAGKGWDGGVDGDGGVRTGRGRYR